MSTPGEYAVRYWPTTPPRVQHGLAHPVPMDSPLNLPHVGMLGGSTIVLSPPNALLVTIFSPRCTDNGERLKRTFMVDINATFEASMRYSCEHWDAEFQAVDFVIKLEGLPDVPIQASDMIGQFTSHTHAEPRHIFVTMVLKDPPPSPETVLGASYFNGLLLIFQILDVITAQLHIDADHSLASIARLACDHFGKDDFVRSLWFLNDEEIDGQNVTPAQLRLMVNHTIRIIGVGSGVYEFFI